MVCMLHLRNTTIRKRALHFVYIWSVPIRFAVVLATPFQVSYCLLLAVSLYSVMIYFSTIQALGEVGKTEPKTNTFTGDVGAFFN